MTITKISIEWQPISGTFGQFGHLYLVGREAAQTDDEGYAISAYPEGESENPKDPQFFGTDRLEINKAYADGAFGSLNGGKCRLLQDTHDAYDVSETEADRDSLDLTTAIQAAQGMGANLDTIWKDMVTHAQELSDAQLNYDLIEPTKAGVFMINSNSVIASMLAAIGVNVKSVLPDPNQTFPGSDTLLVGEGDQDIEGFDYNDLIINSLGGDNKFYGGENTDLRAYDITDGEDAVLYDSFSEVDIVWTHDDTDTDGVIDAGERTYWDITQKKDANTFNDEAYSIEYFLAEDVTDNKASLDLGNSLVKITATEKTGTDLQDKMDLYGDHVGDLITVSFDSGETVSVSDFFDFVATDFDDTFALAQIAGRTIDAGTGTDTIDYSAVTHGVDVDLVAGTAKHENGTGPTDTLTSFETLILPDFDSVFAGSSGADDVTAGAEDDVLTGAAGDDVLTGQMGFDALEGGNDDDEYVFNFVREDASAPSGSAISVIKRTDDWALFDESTGNGTDKVTIQGSAIDESDLTFAEHGDDLVVFIERERSGITIQHEGGFIIKNGRNGSPIESIVIASKTISKEHWDDTDASYDPMDPDNVTITTLTTDQNNFFTDLEHRAFSRVHSLHV